jgi:hypothetical protein
MGEILALLNVKYVIVNLTSENQDRIRHFRQYGTPYISGDPGIFVSFLNKQKGLRLVVRRQDFLIYENKEFTPLIYAANSSVVVTGSFETLAPLSYGSYMDMRRLSKKPVLLFISEMGGSSGFSVWSLLENRDVKNMVFCDKDSVDLAVELLSDQYVKVSSSQERGFRVEEQGKYLVLANSGEQVCGSKRGKMVNIEIDGQSLVLGGGDSVLEKGTRWRKIMLKRGEHNLRIVSSRSETEHAEVILVSEKELEKCEAEIQNFMNRPGTNLGYLFSRNEGNLVNKSFCVPWDSGYIVRAKLSPNFVRARIPGSSGLNLELRSPDELEKWSFKPSNVTCSHIVESGALILSAYFDGDSEEDEFVQMRREGIKVDLQKYPWFDLTYMVEDSKVQTIETVLGVDFDRDGVVDEYIRGICPRAASTEFGKFSYNVLGKVKRCFPDKKHYDLLELELYPHKTWRVDCKSFKRRGKYEFHIKGVEFCDCSEDLLEVCDYALNSNMGEEDEFGKWTVSSNLGEYSCNIQGENLVATARFGEKIDENVTLSRSFENLNLGKFPFIELEYKIDDPLFQNLEVILSLDFDRDGIVDKDIFSSISLDRTFKTFKFNAFEVVKETYPDMKGYYLLQIRLRLREGRKNFMGFERKGKYSWYIKSIKIYSTSFVLPDDFVFDGPVFEIDGEEHRFGKKFKDKEEVEDVLFSREVYLKKGDHSISTLLGEKDNFEVDWIVIEPMKKRLPAKNEPKIVFRRVAPTKYEVDVKGAKEAFWLVFSETFHEGWRLYCSPSPDSESFREIVADYPELGVSEGKHEMRFTPKDIRYLFRGTDVRKHYLVNGYANGWYVEPDELSLGENFKLTLYFWPQSLFCLGLGISGLIFAGSVACLVRCRRKRN